MPVYVYAQAVRAAAISGMLGAFYYNMITPRSYAAMLQQQV
jgi:hypothetical protein